MGKFKELKSQIISKHGYIKTVSLNDFIGLIEYKLVNKGEAYNDKVLCTRDPQRFGQSTTTELLYWEEEPTKVMVDLVPSGYTRASQLKLIRYFLLDQSRMADISNNKLEEAMLKAIDNHSYNYGSPTHIVRVANRLWMVANPDDFIIFFNRDENKLGLFVKDDKLTKIYSVHKGEPKTLKLLGQN